MNLNNMQLRGYNKASKSLWVSDVYEKKFKNNLLQFDGKYARDIRFFEVQWTRVPFRERVLIVMISAVSSTIEM